MTEKQLCDVNDIILSKLKVIEDGFNKIISCTLTDRSENTCKKMLETAPQEIKELQNEFFPSYDYLLSEVITILEIGSINNNSY